MKLSVVCVDVGGTTTKAAVVHRLNSIPTQPGAESYFAALCGLLVDLVQSGLNLLLDLEHDFQRQGSHRVVSTPRNIIHTFICS
jgi:hypothetical protein